MSEQFEMIAKTFQGLEEILAEELTALGANDIQIGRRMVSFTGDKRMMYKANFCLRTAIRILKPIKNFTAKDADRKNGVQLCGAFGGFFTIAPAKVLAADDRAAGCQEIGRAHV